MWHRFSEGIANGDPDEAVRYDELYRRRIEERLALLNRYRLAQDGLDDPISEEEVFGALRKMRVGRAPPGWCSLEPTL